MWNVFGKILTSGLFVSIVGGTFLLFVGWFGRWKFDRWKAKQEAKVEPQPDLELLPLSWYLDMLPTVKTLHIQFYAVNRSKKPLRIDRATVLQFCPNGETYFDHLPLTGHPYTIPGRTTKSITFNHTLLDTQVASILSRNFHGRSSGGISFTASWRAGKHIRDIVPGNWAIDGFISAFPVLAPKPVEAMP